MGERPTDPYDALKYDAELAARKAFHEEHAKQQAELKEHTQKNEINKIIEQVQSDPLRDEVYQGIMEFIGMQPPALRNIIERQIDSNVDAFKQIYLGIRDKIESSRNAKKSETVKKVESQPQAPILEKSGASEPEVSAKAKTGIKEAKRKAILSADNWDEYADLMAKKFFG